MKKLAVFALVLVLAVSVLAGCGQNNQPAPNAGSEKEAPRIGLILATGGLGDKSFNDSGFAGVERAKNELGIEFDYVEPKEIAEFETYQREFAQSKKYDLIISLGFDQADALTKVAAEFPEQKFVLVDSVVEAPNVASITFKDYEKTFLIGAFAAQMTKKDNIGSVGGMDIPLINAFIAGYEAGAKYINKDIKVTHKYVGGWADPTTAKELAVSMYDKGADIVYQCAGGSGLGVFAAAEEKQQFAIGTDSNQNYLKPDNIMLSAVRKLDNVIFQQIEKTTKGEWAAGIYNLGLKEDAVGYALEESNLKIPQEVVAKVEEIKAKIISGELVIPSKLEDVEAFLANNK